MRRLLFILIVACLFASAVAWIASREGTLMLTAGNYEVRTGIGVAIFMVLLIVVFLMFLFRLTGVALRTPTRLSEWFRARRSRKGYEALTSGLVAAAAGDAQAARRLAKRAEKMLPGLPLNLLLIAQAAQLEGNEDRQTSSYRDMLKHPDLEFLGLRGLFMQAMRKGKEEEALSVAQRAHALKPKAAWAANALFDLYAARKNWNAARSVLTGSLKGRLVASDVARRREAVLLTAQAVEAEKQGQMDEAQQLALNALALAPLLVPAAALAARQLAQSGRTWRAQDVIEAAWTKSPHPALAASYAAIFSEDDANTRARRLNTLAQLNPDHLESRLVIAEQAIALHRWQEARAALAPLAQGFATARVCLAMAEIAQMERGDIAAAQGWLSRAAKSPRDAQWRCGPCGYVTPDWTAVCPNCGAFDSLVWTTPTLEGAAPLANLSTEAPERAEPEPPPVFANRPKDSGSALAERPVYEPRSARATLPSFGDEPFLSRPPDDPGPLDSFMFDEPGEENENASPESPVRNRTP